MSTIGDNIKLFIVQMFLPSVIGIGEAELQVLLEKIATEQPAKFALALQILYPAFKGVVEPLANATKSKIDDMVAHPTVVMLEAVMTEFNVPIPVVIPLDFTKP